MEERKFVLLASVSEFLLELFNQKADDGRDLIFELSLFLISRNADWNEG